MPSPRKTKPADVGAAAVPAKALEHAFPKLNLPIQPPYPPAEAKSVSTLPHESGWLYEPKWDGFRCLAFRQGDEVVLQSKAGQPLGRYFPEIVAALLALPKEPFEQAQIDGANRWQTFWHITLPLLRSALVVALIFRAIFTIKVFDVIYVITQGGPAFSTENFTIFAYLQAFSYWRMGYASAAAVLFFLLILAVTLPMIALRRKSWEY